MKDINQQLEDYSKINFQNKLENLENDVNRQINLRQIGQNSVAYFMEKFFGMSVFTSASTICSIFVLGMLWGANMQADMTIDNHDALGLKVFSPHNVKFPLPLLDFKA